jgi:folate-binding Fe-S cluster repair protein YgfZ
MKRKSISRRRSLPFFFSDGAPAVETTVVYGDTKIGEITSTRGEHALARIRIDRLIKAKEASETIAFIADNKNGELIEPNWLSEQIEAMEKS